MSNQAADAISKAIVNELKRMIREDSGKNKASSWMLHRHGKKEWLAGGKGSSDKGDKANPNPNPNPNWLLR